MTDDIVARLRKGTRTPYGLPVQSDEARLHITAADEIERLRAELAAMTEHWEDAMAANSKLCVIHLAERDALRAQLAEARAALEPFAKVDVWEQYEDNERINVGDLRIGDLRFARAVLEKIKGDDRE